MQRLRLLASRRFTRCRGSKAVRNIFTVQERSLDMLFFIRNRPLAQQNIAQAAILFVAVCANLFSTPAVQAQSYPSKPVTIIVPFAAGGGTDLGARLIAQKLAAKWGQSVVVDNKAGAGGIVGVEAAVRAKPDGYTPLVGNVGTQSINPVLYKNLPYDLDKTFAPISLIAELGEIFQALIQQGAKPRSSTPAQLTALIETDRKRYTKIINDKDISLERFFWTIQ